MEQKSILIIEDDMIWHKLLSRILGDAGYKVRIVTTCAEGVKLATFHKPDCVISDFHLPDGDAVSVCLALRADKSTERIPIIIFSSDPGAESAAYLECRANKFILKGSVEELYIAVEKILRSACSVQLDGS